LGECLGFQDSQKYDSISVEIRAAAGGEEAGLFSLELAKIYQRYISN
jgi:protein subunit release factor A